MTGETAPGEGRRSPRERLAQALTIFAALATISYPAWGPAAAARVKRLMADDQIEQPVSAAPPALPGASPRHVAS